MAVIITIVVAFSCELTLKESFYSLLRQYLLVIHTDTLENDDRKQTFGKKEGERGYVLLLHITLLFSMREYFILKRRAI